MKYQKEMLEADIARMGEHEYRSQKIKESFTWKAKFWSYEKEIRTMFPKECFYSKKSNGTTFDFSKILRSGIRRIDFGLNFPRKQIDDIKLMLTEYKDIEYYQAECMIDQYGLHYREI